MKISKYLDKTLSEYSPVDHKEIRYHHSLFGRHVKEHHYGHQQASYQYVDKKKTDTSQTK